MAAVRWKVYTFRSERMPFCRCHFHFQMHFLEWILLYFDWHTEVCSQDPRFQLKKSSSGSGNGLQAPSHHLNLNPNLSQCSPKCLTTYGVTRTQWISWAWNILATLHNTIFTDALTPCVTNTSPTITQCWVLFCYTNEFENTVYKMSAIFILASMCYSRQAHDWSPYHLTITADLTGPIHFYMDS